MNDILQGLFIFNAKYAAYIQNTYLAIQCLNILVFTITGGLLAYKMAKLSRELKSAGLRRNTDKSALSMMLLLVGSAFGMLLYIAGSAITQTPQVSTDGGWYAIWFLIEFGAITTSLFQLHAMRPHSHEHASSRSTKSNSNLTLNTTNPSARMRLDDSEVSTTSSTPTTAVSGLQSSESASPDFGLEVIEL